ncbi:MAG: DNA replication/repair protein RecF [Bifidobacteriaceae bacterium]|jgi:DNA replication and repair protein RecF|nr:DNA replication/repair protein RecF [Bifidobacteriaceae bacterium]
MLIKTLELINFRSHRHLTLNLSPKVNVFVGRNGAGKTNILEAIYCLATAESHRTTQKSALIHKQELEKNENVPVEQEKDVTSLLDYAIIRAKVINEKADSENTFAMQITESKTYAKLNSSEPVPASRAVGYVKTTLFSPQDTQIVLLGPEYRRKFIDSVIIQLDSAYLELLHEFDKVAKQRKALIKSLFTPVFMNHQPLGENFWLWTNRFLEFGTKITETRAKFITELEKHAASKYKEIANGKPYNLNLNYLPSITDETRAKLPQIAMDEIRRGTNLFGPMRDELELKIEDYPAKSFASSGEQWSLVLALKFAAFELLSHKEMGILLLDDVFSELDDVRRAEIANLVLHSRQTLITAASMDDVPKNIDAKIFEVANNNVREVV